MSEPAVSAREQASTELSFSLYSAANRMIRLHKPFLEPLGLTFPQYLAILALLNDAPIAVGALGARLDMDTGTITPLLKRLDAAGLVSRTRDPADERRVLVDLTARGRALEDDVRGVKDKIQSECHLTDTGIEDLRRTLDDLVQPSGE
jgi:DNA-binding MarR family transcriptional regulator